MLLLQDLAVVECNVESLTPRYHAVEVFDGFRGWNLTTVTRPSGVCGVGWDERFGLYLLPGHPILRKDRLEGAEN